MPEMDGLEAEIEQQKRHCNIAFTSPDKDDIRRAGDTSCFTGHLRKPFKFDDLRLILKDAAQRDGEQAKLVLLG